MIRDKLKAIIEDVFGTPVADVTDATTLADLGSDSLMFLEFVLSCENKFGVDLDSFDGHISETSTVVEIEAHIESVIARAKEET